MTTTNVGVGTSAQRTPRVPIQKSDAPDHGTGRTLSDSARSLAAAREAVRQAVDVREQRVADIRQRVADGTYAVPSRLLARKMLDATNI
jgi:flagellar biosynthesis anti-sigma factor FlgM